MDFTIEKGLAIINNDVLCLVSWRSIWDTRVVDGGSSCLMGK